MEVVSITLDFQVLIQKRPSLFRENVLGAR